MWSCWAGIGPGASADSSCVRDAHQTHFTSLSLPGVIEPSRHVSCPFCHHVCGKPIRHASLLCHHMCDRANQTCFTSLSSCMLEPSRHASLLCHHVCYEPSSHVSHLCKAFSQHLPPLSSCLMMIVGFFARTVLNLVAATSQELALMLGSSNKTVNLARTGVETVLRSTGGRAVRVRASPGGSQWVTPGLTAPVIMLFCYFL